MRNMIKLHLYMIYMWIKINRVFLIEGAIPDWVGSIGEIVVMNDFGFNNDTWETIKIYLSSLTSIEILDDQNWLIKDSDYGMHWGYSNLFLTTDGGVTHELSASRNAKTSGGGCGERILFFC